MAGSLDSDLARIQAAKGRFDIPQVFKHRLGFCGALVEFLGKVWVQRIQEFGVIQFILYPE